MTDEDIRLAVGALLAPQGGPGHAAERRRAAGFLLAHPDEGHAAVVQALTDTPLWAGGASLIELLPRFGHPEDVPLLAEILRQADDPHQIEAAQALARHPHGDALEALMEALDGPPQAALYAAQALGERGDSAARPRLEALASRPDAPDRVRRAAAESSRALA